MIVFLHYKKITCEHKYYSESSEAAKEQGLVNYLSLSVAKTHDESRFLRHCRPRLPSLDWKCKLMLKRWDKPCLVWNYVTYMQGPWRDRVYTMVQWVAGDNAADTAVQVGCMRAMMRTMLTGCCRLLKALWITWHDIEAITFNISFPVNLL